MSDTKGIIGISQNQDAVADEINTIYNEMADMAQRTIDKAIYIGGLVYHQKQQLKHGEFIPWVEQSLSFDRYTATKYIKLYQQQEKINVACMQHLGLNSALKEIRQAEKQEQEENNQDTTNQQETKREESDDMTKLEKKYNAFVKELNKAYQQNWEKISMERVYDMIGTLNNYIHGGT